jgi:hypothetical protein
MENNNPITGNGYPYRKSAQCRASTQWRRQRRVCTRAAEKDNSKSAILVWLSRI